MTIPGGDRVVATARWEGCAIYELHDARQGYRTWLFEYEGGIWQVMHVPNNGRDETPSTYISYSRDQPTSNYNNRFPPEWYVGSKIKTFKGHIPVEGAIAIVRQLQQAYTAGIATGRNSLRRDLKALLDGRD
jgi:hypothetical protein